MIVAMKYAGRSGIVNGLREGRVAFATNTLRETTFLHGFLTQPILFREALGALYEVVVSDFKYRPRDRLAFRAWLDQQDAKFLANLGVKTLKIKVRLEELEERLEELNRQRLERQKDFHRARLNYFNFVYLNQYERNLILDPVIAVHPDEISFEAFSRDESTYARLAASLETFGRIRDHQCGTTNIDFSARLHGEMERLRTYRQTRFDVTPGGFTVTTEGDAYQEKKIKLPDSWVEGFHQVQSTMTLGLTHFAIAPVDLFNICRFLRRHKKSGSPRALRYELTPGQKVKAVLEPWNHVIELTDSTPFDGPKPMSIRTWGRYRLLTIGRLLPMCRRVDVYLAGFGLPSVYVLDLGPVTFTLALSGWTDNDWTGGAKFDLLSRRLDVTPAELTQVYESLRGLWKATEHDIHRETGLSIDKCRAGLSFLCQVGRAMYDLAARAYRRRDLFGGTFSAQEAAAAVKSSARPSTPQEKAAQDILTQDKIRIIARRPVSTGFKLSGSASGATTNERVRPLLHVDTNGQIVDASCTCAFYTKHQLTKGPCEHILALRLAHMRRLEQEGERES